MDQKFRGQIQFDPNEPFQPKRRLRKINIHHLIKLGALEVGFMNPFWAVSRSSG